MLNHDSGASQRSSRRPAACPQDPGNSLWVAGSHACARDDGGFHAKLTVVPRAGAESRALIGFDDLPLDIKKEIFRLIEKKLFFFHEICRLATVNRFFNRSVKSSPCLFYYNGFKFPARHLSYKHTTSLYSLRLNQPKKQREETEYEDQSALGVPFAALFGLSLSILSKYNYDFPSSERDVFNYGMLILVCMPVLWLMLRGGFHRNQFYDLIEEEKNLMADMQAASSEFNRR